MPKKALKKKATKKTNWKVLAPIIALTVLAGAYIVYKSSAATNHQFGYDATSKSLKGGTKKAYNNVYYRVIGGSGAQVYVDIPNQAKKDGPTEWCAKIKVLSPNGDIYMGYDEFTYTPKQLKGNGAISTVCYPRKIISGTARLSVFTKKNTIVGVEIIYGKR